MMNKKVLQKILSLLYNLCCGIICLELFFWLSLWHLYTQDNFIILTGAAVLSAVGVFSLPWILRRWLKRIAPHYAHDVRLYRYICIIKRKLLFLIQVLRINFLLWLMVYAFIGSIAYILYYCFFDLVRFA